MLGQYLLDLMQVCDNELLLQASEPDVARGLIALNASQDMFESVLAQQPNLYGDKTGTVAITAGVDSTTYPANLLRLDKLWMLGPDSMPLYPLEKIDLVGGQNQIRRWPATLISPNARGRVVGYWADGRSIYWSPLPSQADTVRWYGFTPAADITAAGTFEYPDFAALPVAAFAVRLMRAGVGDESADLSDAIAAFNPVVKSMATFNRDRAPQFIYRNAHFT